MKLLYDATELSYFNENSGHRAGVFYVALNLFNEFKKMGIDITFHTDFRRYFFMKNLSEFRNIPLLEENSFINKFISWILYKTDNFPIRLKYVLIVLARIYDKYLYRQNKKNLEQLKGFDAYFSPFTPPSLEISKSDLKRFRMLHDVIPIVEKGMSKSSKDWHNKVYNTINDTDYYVANSEYTKADVLKYFPFIKDSHIKTTLLGANDKFYPQAVSEFEEKFQEKYIFSLCTLGKRKNIIFGIKAFFEFINKNNIKDLKLVLGGGVWNRFKGELHSVLEKYDCSKVVLTGYIQEDDLRKYYSNALCFIYPSLYEGFGLPVLEAMQCGCPVISSNRTSLPEVVGNCGILINPEDENEMIAAYEKMYYDSEYRKLCSLKGLERAKLFSWEKCAREIIEYINTSVK